MLENSKLSYYKRASTLPNYDELKYDKNALANGYCDAEEAGDELLRSAYFSALMLAYWGKIRKWKNESASLHLQDEDFESWLVDCLNDALHYRSWRPMIDGKPNPKYQENDPYAADRSINFFCGKKRSKEYQASNKQKRCANATTYSLDASVDENGDYALDVAGATENPEHENGAKSLVFRFLNNNKFIEALIIDGIAFQDSFKESKTGRYEIDVDEETGEETKQKVYDYSSSFDPRKLVKHLSTIDESFMKTYFNIEYAVTDLESETIYNKLKSMNNTKLYNMINKTIIEIKNNKELLSYFFKG